MDITDRSLSVSGYCLIVDIKKIREGSLTIPPDSQQGRDAFDFQALFYFIQIAEAGGFSRASAMLSVSQPTLTRCVQRLEKQFGAQLFSRTGRGVLLTEAGESLLKNGKSIMARVHRTHAEIDDIGKNPGGSVVLGLAPIAGKILSVPVSKRFLREVPSARLRIVECFTGYVREWVACGRIDVGILYQDGVTAPLDGDRLWDEEFVLVCPMHDGIARQAEIRFADVAKLPLILPSRPHGLRAKIDETALRQRVTLNLAVETDGLNVILDLVRHGLGYAILTPPALYGLEATADLVGISIVEPRISSTVMAVCSKQGPLTNAIRSLIRIVREEAQVVRAGRGCAQGFRPPTQLGANGSDRALHRPSRTANGDAAHHE